MKVRWKGSEERAICNHPPMNPSTLFHFGRPWFSLPSEYKFFIDRLWNQEFLDRLLEEVKAPYAGESNDGSRISNRSRSGSALDPRREFSLQLFQAHLHRRH